MLAATDARWIASMSKLFSTADLTGWHPTMAAATAPEPQRLVLLNRQGLPRRKPGPKPVAVVSPIRAIPGQYGRASRQTEQSIAVAAHDAMVASRPLAPPTRQPLPPRLGAAHTGDLKASAARGEASRPLWRTRGQEQ